MNYKVKLLPEALLDIKDSIDWYNAQKEGLGNLYYQAVKSRLAYIENNPLHYQISYRNVRNAPLNKFPFQVNYQLEESSKSIVVLALTHTSRDPQIWKSRRQ